MRTGIDVLNRGRPVLPEQLSYLMAIPVAHWTAQHRAVVLVLQFQRNGRQHEPMAWHVTYTRTETGWTPDRHFTGTSFGHDPIAKPGSQRDLGRQRHGHRRRQRHHPAWPRRVICTEQPSPYPHRGTR